MYEQPSMPRPPYIKVGAEGAISPQASAQVSSTLREQQNNNRSTAPLPSNDSPPAQTPQGQPCSAGVGNNPLTIPKHSRRAVSRMPKARRSRLSLTRCAGWATFHAAPTINQSGRGRCNQFSRFCIRIFHAQRAAKQLSQYSSVALQ